MDADSNEDGKVSWEEFKAQVQKQNKECKYITIYSLLFKLI